MTIIEGREESEAKCSERKSTYVLDIMRKREREELNQDNVFFEILL